MKDIKTIGVLTSGGDAPGMNAAIRAVVRTALVNGLKVYGIRHGYAGLLNNDIFEMDIRSVSDIIHRGGTVLYTARSKEFNSVEGVLKGKENCIKNNLDALVCIGGDGTFRGARDLSRVGIPCIGVPGTIDNDIACSDYTIGYDTAMNTAIQMIDKLRDTAQSHDRCSVIEVMGRKAGYIALNTGISCGATSMFVNEIAIDIQKDVVDKILAAQKTGKNHYVIIVSEGVGGVHEIAKQVEESTGIVSRATVLGHVQRGGSPTVRDRVVATQMGYAAVTALIEGRGDRVIAKKHGKIVEFDIEEALNMKNEFPMDLYEIGNIISV